MPLRHGTFPKGADGPGTDLGLALLVECALRRTVRP